MKSLYYRVLFITIATIAVSSLLGFLASNLYYHAKLKPFNDEKLVRMAEEVKTFAAEHPDVADSYMKSASELGYEIYVTDGSGEDLFFGNKFRERDLLPENIRLVLAGGVYHGVASFPNRPFVTGFFENSLSNTVGIPLQLNGKTYALFLRPDTVLQFGELRIFFALVGGLTVAFSLLFFLVSTTYLVKPITRLSEATKKIAQGQYHLTLPKKRRDEIGQLAVHFTIMGKELERVEQARRQFVADVSHEIQSPLTSIHGFAQTLANPELSAEDRIRYAAVIAEESGHLSRLGRQLLTLSALEQSVDGMNRTAFRLRPHIRQVAQVLEWQLAEKKLALTLSVPDDLVIQADEDLLSQVWMNLLANAVKYTPEEGTIGVSAKRNGEELEIAVSDTGEGIPAAELPFLFDRFYRADHSRERSSGGSGLGLSIVQKIVHMHKGQIEVVSKPGQGTAFTVKLPQL